MGFSAAKIKTGLTERQRRTNRYTATRRKAIERGAHRHTAWTQGLQAPARAQAGGERGTRRRLPGCASRCVCVLSICVLLAAHTRKLERPTFFLCGFVPGQKGGKIRPVASRPMGVGMARVRCRRRGLSVFTSRCWWRFFRAVYPSNDARRRVTSIRGPRQTRLWSPILVCPPISPAELALSSLRPRRHRHRRDDADVSRSAPPPSSCLSPCSCFVAVRSVLARQTALRRAATVLALPEKGPGVRLRRGERESREAAAVATNVDA